MELADYKVLDSCVPFYGSFRAWKKLRHGVLAELEIPAGASRCTAGLHNGKAEVARVIRLEGADVGLSIHGDPPVEYRVGETVRTHEWRGNRHIGGIYFWLTKAEAERYRS